MIIGAFLTSLLTMAVLVLIWFKRRIWIKETAIPTIIWFVLGSPLTVIVLALNYEVVFGKMIHGSP
jgi:hypothetical protein